MIRIFSDHAADERTFLAWQRTAIAVMALGFLGAKFDRFLQIAARSLSGGRRTTRIPGGGLGGTVGVVVIPAGTLMVMLAAVYLVGTSRAIDSAAPTTDRGRVDLVLAGLMVVLGIAVLLYLVQTLLAGISVALRVRPPGHNGSTGGGEVASPAPGGLPPIACPRPSRPRGQPKKRRMTPRPPSANRRLGRIRKLTGRSVHEKGRLAPASLVASKVAGLSRQSRS